MAIKYTNRKGKTFYLHVGKTKKGNPKYYFSQSQEGELINSLPDGYEIYENPDSQVFLRKIQPGFITGQEKSLVEKGIQKYSDIKYYKVKIKKKMIVIYTGNEEVDEVMERLRVFNPFKADEGLKQMLLRYQPVLRFELVDEEKRLFQTRRFCFLGSIDDWIHISGMDTLENLVKRFVRYLGQDSFYELI